jgi:tetratricopeptide (TPR) repeat protein
VHNNLGQAYLRQDRLAEAQTQFQQALTLNANHANARLNLARTLEAQGNNAAAAAEYRRALELFPADSPQAQAILQRLQTLSAN